METLHRTVLVVENEDFLRALLAQSLGRSGFTVATASNALEAKRAISQVDPDAVLLDIDLGPGPTGLDIATQLSITSPEIAIVFLTDLPDSRFSRAGHEVKDNQAYLNKKVLKSPEVLAAAINAVLYEESVEEFRHDQIEGRPLAQLTRVQLEILKLIAEGKTNQQIATIRNRSLGAIESAISRTLESLGIDRNTDSNLRVEAARTYFQAITSYGRR